MIDKKNWITYNKRASSITFKNSYKVSGGFKKVYIHITAVGWYHLYINGKRVDKDVFSPGWTDYKKRIQYQTYDITRLVDNNISIRIDTGEGWGGGDHFAWRNPGEFVYFPISINYQIEIKGDKKTRFINSDTTTKTFTNKIISSDIYGGESVDQLREEEFLGNAKKIKIDSKLIPQEGENIIFGESFIAKKMWKAPNGDLLIDFGQNATGMIEINIKGKKGDKITYTPSEVLDKDGNFYNQNYRAAKSTFSFVLSGKQETLRPEFSFLGGRYIKLIEYPKYIKKENFTFRMVHSRLDQTCFFTSGNPKINRLYLNTRYGQLSNYLDVPTDCPQRNERLGWTGDVQAFVKTASIHFNVHQFFVKWLHELIISQYDDGRIDDIVPLIYWKGGNGHTNSGWGDVATIAPYTIYQAYGDKKLLKECIPMMERWVMFLTNNCKKPFIPAIGNDYGDWLALDRADDNGRPGLTRFDLINTAFYAYSVSILIKAKKALKMKHFKDEKLLEKIKKAYQKEFIKNGHMVGRKAKLFSGTEQTAYTQTGLVLTLYFSLMKKEDKNSLLKDLVNLIKECGNKIATGFLGTPYILYVLSENKKERLAYDLLFQEEFPSWLYSVNKGATTMWEHYDSIKEDGSFWDYHMNSFNHYAYGSVFSWIFNNAVGINIVKPDYKEILIKPIIDERFGFIDCTYKSSRGDISVKWEIKGNKVHYQINVPKKIKATIILNKQKYQLNKDGKLNTTITYK